MHLELHELTIRAQNLVPALTLVAIATCLEFRKGKIEGYVFIREVPVKLPKLECLSICYSDTVILCMIETTSLIEFSSKEGSRTTLST